MIALKSANNFYQKHKQIIFIIGMINIIGWTIYGIIQLVNKEGFQNGGKKIVFLLASWCGHCKTFKPIINKFKENNRDINVEIHEDNKEKNQEYNVEGFPTIKLVKENGEVIDFNGPRTEEGLSDFYNSN